MAKYQLPLLKDFKKKEGDKTTALIILKNNRGMQVALTNYGARIVSLIVPDKDGNLVDVVLGFNTISDYLQADEPYHGATIGRYANRISRGAFALDGHEYHVAPNNGPNALHGGNQGFHTKIWDRRLNNPNQVTFYYTSPDGEEGFPGQLTVSVDYILTDNNELQISYRAKSDKDTIINLTNHAYFNLNGEGTGTIVDHVVELAADAFLPIDAVQIPLGEVRSVIGTPFDFREPKRISADIAKEDEQLKRGGYGYDHTFVLTKNNADKNPVVASAYAEKSGIKLQLLTTEPGIQFYTGNALTGKDIGKTGNHYSRQDAFCFETQHFPDAPNQPQFPSTLLKAEQAFQSQTIYRFNVLK
ncbi:aldose epimerase family protein [Olivibacter sp. XZL3]|uniref:aldose epimerase family protein n=1 Tax=Olivibacter sp. XZL3 TaxID=1735116 RepID=UPI0010659029|nr:aldose epimerase family protein [Olivibacter sp. XZL3]